MIWLFLGLALWVLAHGFKRFAPEARARLGDRGKGLVAVAVLASVVLMVIGFRGWDANIAYELPGWSRHLNNLLMLISVILFGLGSSKSTLRGMMRHPMLTGLATWSVAHLLVNGDWASIVLFGGLGIWALAEMQVINRAEPEWERPEPGNMAGTLKLLAVSSVLYLFIAGIHIWLGYWPFGV